MKRALSLCSLSCKAERQICVPKDAPSFFALRIPCRAWERDERMSIITSRKSSKRMAIFEIFEILAILAIGVLLPAGAYADIALSGTSGLITIPTVDVLDDGDINIGISYLRQSYRHLDKPETYDMIPLWVSVGYLPSLELSARLTTMPKLSRAGAPKPPYRDGMLSFQWKVLGESRRLPAVAIGARDVYGFALFNTLYLVFSKHIPIHRVRVGVHLGHGVDWMGGRYGVVDGGKTIPTTHRMIGTFGGIGIPITRTVDFALEYDTTKLNFGARVQLLSEIQFQIALLGGNHLAVGVNGGFNLK
ncbi:MAG: hypothetical protein B1H02_06245 [Candidatus Latescibacteria bacterium 4484_107]|nr:MAG: hypothetical protein B1H02_06245 [Candidatus Latescibacteria bacterium 4484_107]